MLERLKNLLTPDKEEVKEEKPEKRMATIVEDEPLSIFPDEHVETSEQPPID